MAQDLHYELFQKCDGRWQFREALFKREDALSRARSLAGGRQIEAVKLIEHGYDIATGHFEAACIFASGEGAAAPDTEAGTLLWTGPDDFFSLPFRKTIALYLGDFLARQKLTPTEFVHRADALKTFEGTDSVFKHAIQKIALVQAKATRQSAQSVIKILNTEVTAALRKVYEDDARGRFPELKAGGIAATAQALAGEPDADYLFAGALARYLKPASSWPGKLEALLAVLDEAPAAGEAHRLIAGTVDLMLEEMLSSFSSLYELIGARESLFVTVTDLASLLRGGEQGAIAGLPALGELARRFAQRQLPQAHRAVSLRVQAELKSKKRLCPTSIVDEIKAIRTIAGALTRAAGPCLAPEELTAAFTLRSRLVANERALNEVVADTSTPDDKIERILYVLEQVVGGASRNEIGRYLMRLISSAGFEGHYLTAKQAPDVMLKRLADMQDHILRSSLAKEMREDIAAVLDRLAVQVETKTGFFKLLEAKGRNGVEVALSYLRLCKGGLTQGRLSDRAYKAALKCTAQPNFTSTARSCAAAAAEAGDRDALGDLASLLEMAVNPAEPSRILA